MHAIQRCTLHSALYMSMEVLPVAPQLFRRFLVEGVVRIRIEEEEKQADSHRVEIQDRVPLFAQDVQAYIPIKVKIGMVYPLEALDLRWIMGVVIVHRDAKSKCAALVYALIWTYDELELHDGCGVRKLDLHSSWQVELRNVCVRSTTTHLSAYV